MTSATEDEKVDVACRVEKYRRGLALDGRGLHGYIRRIPERCCYRSF
jgi:hypothetical protein